MGHWWNDPDSKHAFILSWFSVVITITAVVAGFVIANLTGSSLIFAYGVENLVDFLSSVVVLWRFYCPSHTDPVREAILAKREQRASIAISLILVILGFGIMIAAIGHLEKGPEGDHEDSDQLIVIGLISIFVFGFMAFVKFHYSSMLSSPSLHKDGICSLIGTVLALSLVINSAIIKSNSKAWWLDPVVALLCGLASLYVALKSIYHDYVIQGIPLLSPVWWISSQGSMPEGGVPSIERTTTATNDNDGDFNYDKDDKNNNNSTVVELSKSIPPSSFSSTEETNIKSEETPASNKKNDDGDDGVEIV